MPKKHSGSGGADNAAADPAVDAFWKPLKKGNGTAVEDHLTKASDDQRKVLVSTRHGKDDLPLVFAVGKGFDDIVEILLRHGADANAAEAKGAKQTPLLIAAAAGDDVIAQALVNAGADLSAVDVHKQTLFHLTCQMGARNLCLHFLNLDEDSEGEEGSNPSSASVLKTTSEKFAALMSQDAKGLTPLHLVLGEAPNDNSSRDLAVEFLSFTRKHSEAHSGDCHSLVNKRSKGKDTPLHLLLSTQQDSALIASLALDLVELGADCTVENEEGYTPLHLAACGDMTLTLAAIYKAKEFDVCTIFASKTKASLLHVSAEGGALKACEWLRSKCSDEEKWTDYVMLKDSDDKLAIHYALEEGNTTLIGKVGSFYKNLEEIQRQFDEEEEAALAAEEESDVEEEEGDYSGHGAGAAGGADIKQKILEGNARRSKEKAAEAEYRQKLAELEEQGKLKEAAAFATEAGKEYLPPAERTKREAAKKAKEEAAAAAGGAVSEDEDEERETKDKKKKSPQTKKKVVRAGQDEAELPARPWTRWLHKFILFIIIFSALMPLIELVFLGKKK